MTKSDDPWSDAPVPTDFVGLWARRLLIEPDGTRDTETIVWWLQTEHLFVDIRLPADRPDFTGITSLDACGPIEIAYLKRQEGFAGHLEHRPGALAWRRAIDFRPLGGPPDEGSVRWDGPNSFTETGLHIDYLEEWRQVLADEDRSKTGQYWTDADGALIVQVGDAVMRAWDRRPSPAPVGLEDSNADPTSLLNCEISFARKNEEGAAIVQHSTLPWLEGGVIELPALF